VSNQWRTRGIIVACCAIAVACAGTVAVPNHGDTSRVDSTKLAGMVTERETAMINHNLPGVMAQFADNATFINGGGLLIVGKNDIAAFHNFMINNDTADYQYATGATRVRILDDNSALVYYPWKMTWYSKASPADTTLREVGLMTLSAQKTGGRWFWVAVTNQRTPRFISRIDPIDVPASWRK
jgi:uncharacterized protein (TIGR02246 family)